MHVGTCAGTCTYEIYDISLKKEFCPDKYFYLLLVDLHLTLSTVSVECRIFNLHLDLHPCLLHSLKNDH